MDVGMTLPVMEADLTGELLGAWARAVDEGPWSSLCFGERMAFDNPETLTLLGATAAWTARVRLVTTVVVPQLHHPVMLAKALASADLVSGGRVTVGLGVGGREEDYRAAGADPATQTIAELASRAAEMRRVWSGERVSAEVGPVGPPPVQQGGPELLAGAMGPRSVARAAEWADGLAGFELEASAASAAKVFERARTAWAEAGRPSTRLTTSFWFALGDDPVACREQLHRHLRRYMTWLPVELVDELARTAGFAGTPDQLRERLDEFAEAGADEVQLVPTSPDLTQVHLAADVVGQA